MLQMIVAEPQPHKPRGHHHTVELQMVEIGVPIEAWIADRELAQLLHHDLPRRLKSTCQLHDFGRCQIGWLWPSPSPMEWAPQQQNDSWVFRENDWFIHLSNWIAKDKRPEPFMNNPFHVNAPKRPSMQFEIDPLPEIPVEGARTWWGKKACEYMKCHDDCASELQE